MLRQKLMRRIERFHQRVELQNYWLPLAKYEDEWDLLMAAQLKTREDEVNWTDVLYVAESKNGALYEEELAGDRAIIQKMQGIVDEETRLALEAGEEIIRGRKKAPIRVLKP